MKKIDQFIKLFNAAALGHLLTAVHYRFFSPFDWIWLTIVVLANLVNLIIISADD